MSEVALRTMKLTEEGLLKDSFTAISTSFGWFNTLELNANRHTLSRSRRKFPWTGGIIQLVERGRDMRLKESGMPEESEWERYFRPKKALSMLGLKKGMVLADLGCGYGTFTLAGAEIVGKMGFVYAVDIERGMVERVGERAAKKGFRNVRAIRGDITSLKSTELPDGSVDFALLANVVHGTRGKIRLLKDVIRVLRPNGRIAILNWKIGKTPRGPPVKIRPTTEGTVSYLVRAGYEDAKITDIPPHHYAVVALRPLAAGVKR